MKHCYLKENERTKTLLKKNPSWWRILRKGKPEELNKAWSYDIESHDGKIRAWVLAEDVKNESS